MRTRDGVRLDADRLSSRWQRAHFRSCSCASLTDGKLPRPSATRIPSWYADHGYIVVIQDVRGRGTSEGAFRLFADDVADGEDTIAWAAVAAGLVGRGRHVRLFVSGHEPTACGVVRQRPALKALAPAMIGWDIGADWAYENDAFCLAAGLGWATQIGAETARLAGDAEAFDALLSRLARHALSFAVAARPDYVERFGKYTHYQSLARQSAGQQLLARNLAGLSRAIREACRCCSSAAGTIRICPARSPPSSILPPRGPAQTRITIGPWTHFPWTRRVGGHDFGPNARDRYRSAASPLVRPLAQRRGYRASIRTPGPTVRYGRERVARICIVARQTSDAFFCTEAVARRSMRAMASSALSRHREREQTSSFTTPGGRFPRSAAPMARRQARPIVRRSMPARTCSPSPPNRRSNRSRSRAMLRRNCGSAPTHQALTSVACSHAWHRMAKRCRCPGLSPGEIGHEPQSSRSKFRYAPHAQPSSPASAYGCRCGRVFPGLPGQSRHRTESHGGVGGRGADHHARRAAWRKLRFAVARRHLSRSKTVDV